MEPETARNVGYALGMATLGYVAMKFLTRDRKPAPSPIRKEGPNLTGAAKTVLVLIVVGAVASAIGWLAKR